MKVILFQRRIGDPTDQTWEDLGIPEEEPPAKIKELLRRMDHRGYYRMVVLYLNAATDAFDPEIEYFEIVKREDSVCVDL